MSVDQLQQAARALGDLLPKVVFHGGATVGLWLSDPVGRAPRVTYDVDVVAEVTSIGAYASFQAALRARRFREDIESGVICRWRHADSDLILDAIPLRPELAGFTDRWLTAAAAAAVALELPGGTVIRAIPPQWLMVVKLKARRWTAYSPTPAHSSPSRSPHCSRTGCSITASRVRWSRLTPAHAPRR